MSKEVPATLPKSSIDSESKKKGEDGQDELQAWFDRNCFGYVAVCQAQDTFARLFSGHVKRPDFLLVVDGLGMIAVDAKNCEPSKIGKSYTLAYDREVKKAIMFERVFRLPVWYAYRGQTPGEWLWISALKAFEVGRLAGRMEATTSSCSLQILSGYGRVPILASCTRNDYRGIGGWPPAFLWTFKCCRQKKVQMLRGSLLRIQCGSTPGTKEID